MTVKFFGVLFFFVSLGARPCTAQTPTSQAEAKRFFQEGNTFAKEGDYRRALEAFERSYALLPKAVVLFNIGMCFKALDHLNESAEYLRRYLSEAGDAPKPDLRAEAEKRLEELAVASPMRRSDEMPAVTEIDEDEQTTVHANTRMAVTTQQGPLESVITTESETKVAAAEASPPLQRTAFKRRRFFYTQIRAVWFSGALALVGSGAAMIGVTYGAYRKDPSRRDDLIPLNTAGWAVSGVGLAGITAFLISGPLVRGSSRETHVALQWNQHAQGFVFKGTF